MRAPRFLVTATAIVVAFSAEVASAQSTADTDTPGTLTLLASQAPSVLARLKLQAGLKDANPRTRAAAARVAWALTLPDLIEPITQALANETDSLAASEEIRALLFMQGAEAINAVEAALPRSGSQPALVFAEWLARVEPKRLVSDLRRFTAADADTLAVGEIVRMAVTQHPDLRQSILRAWLEAAPAAGWLLFLTGRDIDPTADAAVLVEALRSPKDEVRLATVWHVLSLLSQRIEVPAAVREAAATPNSAMDPAWEAFGRELVARTKRNETAGDRTQLVVSEGSRHPDLLRVLAASPAVAKNERAAAVAALGGDVLPPPSLRPPPPPGTDSVSMRLASTAWAGFISDLLAAAGCPLSSTPQFMAARLAYRADGAPLRVGIDPNGPAPCTTALTALARTSVAERDHAVTRTDDGTEWILLPLERSSAECVDTPSTATLPVGSQPEGHSKITTPKKIRDVRPAYPQSAQAARISGTVVLEATITATGCVSRVHVTQGLSPSLDFAALQAVTGWRFTPTLVDGAPVPVSMTVTVKFSLQ